jgi:hypothetical protein
MKAILKIGPGASIEWTPHSVVAMSGRASAHLAPRGVSPGSAAGHRSIMPRDENRDIGHVAYFFGMDETLPHYAIMRKSNRTTGSSTYALPEALRDRLSGAAGVGYTSGNDAGDPPAPCSTSTEKTA